MNLVKKPQVPGSLTRLDSMVPRMSFYTPLNPVLQRELGSIAATDRSTVFPVGTLEDSTFEDIEAGAAQLRDCLQKDESDPNNLFCKVSFHFPFLSFSGFAMFSMGFPQEGTSQSPWRNGRFRVLVGTQCASLYCVTFWGSFAEIISVSQIC